MNEKKIISFINSLDSSYYEVWQDELGRYDVVLGYGILESFLTRDNYRILPCPPPSQLYISEEKRSIVSIGGFHAHNMGKYEAEKMNFSLITVPCPLSNDSFGTNRYSIGINEQSPSLQSLFPIKTIFDIKHIIEVDLIKSIIGTGEFIGLYYSLLDYSLKINKDFSKLLHYIVERIELIKSAINREDDRGIICNLVSSLVLKCLVMRVNHDHTIGCGIDHSFARCFEKNNDIVHGKAVFCGSVLSSALYPEWEKYGLSTASLIELGNSLGITHDDYNIINSFTLDNLIGDAIEIRPRRSYALEHLTKHRIKNATNILEGYGIYINRV